MVLSILSRYTTIILFLITLMSHGQRIIPVSIETGIDGLPIFTASLYIGNPAVKYKLQVDFMYNHLYLKESLRDTSLSFSNDLKGSDVIHIGKEKHRIKIENHTKMDIYCTGCRGILGFGRKSPFWKLWPSIGFSETGIILGEIESSMFERNLGKSGKVKCTHHEIKEYCIVEKSVLKYPKSHTYNVTVALNPGSPFIYLPDNMYESFMMNKNIYDESSLQGFYMELNLPFSDGYKDDSIFVGDINGDKLGNHHKKDHHTLEFDIHDLIKTGSSGVKFFLVKKYSHSDFPYLDKDTIEVGIPLLTTSIVHKNSLSNEIVLASTLAERNLGIANLIMIVFLATTIAFWSSTGISNRLEGIVYNRNRTVNVVIEILTIIGAGISLVLPSSLRIAQDHPEIYSLAIVSIAFSFVFKILSFVRCMNIQYSISNGTLQITRQVKNDMFEATVMRSVTHEFIVLTAFWILLLERRFGFTSTALVLFVNSYIIYVVTFYLVICSIYVLTSKLSPTLTFPVFLMYTVTLYIYQVAAGYIFFARPIFIRDFQVYEEVLLPFLILLFIVLSSLAVYFAGLHSPMEYKKELKSNILFP